MSAKEIPFGKILENKIILNGWGAYPDREIGVVREDEETSVKYFEERFTELEAKITALETEIESSENKGSFLMKLIHLKELLGTHDGLGDYQSLLDRLTAQEAYLEETIEKNRVRNTQIKQALVEELRVSVEKINWKEATQEIHDIKARWIKTGNPKEELQEELDTAFWGLIDQFFDKKKEFYEDKKRLGEKRKRDYQNVIAKADELENLHGKERFDFIQTLKDEWREIGNIQKEDYSPLLQAFNNKLKPGPRPSQSQSFDIHELNKTLQRFTNGEQPYGFKQLEELKTQLKSYRPSDPEGKNLRRNAFQSIQLLLERDFIDKLAHKRFKNFKELEKGKKRQIRIGILEELINRDKADLDKYQENSANFSSSFGGTMDLIEKKLSQQKGKIQVKETLLQLLKRED